MILSIYQDTASMPEKKASTPAIRSFIGQELTFCPATPPTTACDNGSIYLTTSIYSASENSNLSGLAMLRVMAWANSASF